MTGRVRRQATVGTLALLVGLSCQTGRGERPTGLKLPTQGCVVAEQPLAVSIGQAILEEGGNAADAAVATALALAVVHPQAGNLGGGGFALWVPHEGPGTVLDFREEAPLAYHAGLYLDEAGDVVGRRSLETPLAVGVPGSPAGLFQLWQDHGSGRFSFAELCAPAIELARSGFDVGPFLAEDLASKGPGGRIARDPAATSIFHRAEGGPLRIGDRLIQEDLARTLERFAADGPEGFYRGQTAELLLRTLAAADAREGNLVGDAAMTARDLSSYEVVERAPLIGWFRGYEVLSVPPPSSGGVVLLHVLSVLDGLPLESARDEAGLPTAQALHWWIEAMRGAFADRALHLGDPDPYPDPSAALVPGAPLVQERIPVEELLGVEWIAERRMGIGNRARPDVRAYGVEAMPTEPRESVAPERLETTHLSVLDAEGNAVSLTTTLNGTFGSGILVEGAGFLLNNELDDFSIQAGVPNMFGLVGGRANQLHGGRRPLSSMTPTVVRRGGRQVRLVLGAPGGPRIITSVLQVLLRVLVHDQDLESAVAAPRLHQQWVNGRASQGGPPPHATRTEAALSADLRAALESHHGQTVVEGSAAGLVQAIDVDAAGHPTGVSDPRSDGAVGRTGEPLFVRDR